MARAISGTNLKVQPDDIDCSKHFYSAFGQMETEISANWLVRFAQERRSGWDPFTGSDIEAFYLSAGFTDGFRFNRLICDGFILEEEYSQMERGMWRRYRFTHEFVVRCWAASPLSASFEEQRAILLELW
jgi:hypothetical protein